MVFKGTTKHEGYEKAEYIADRLDEHGFDVNFWWYETLEQYVFHLRYRTIGCFLHVSIDRLTEHIERIDEVIKQIEEMIM